MGNGWRCAGDVGKRKDAQIAAPYKGMRERESMRVKGEIKDGTVVMVAVPEQHSAFSHITAISHSAIGHAIAMGTGGEGLLLHFKR
jgi:hypothetical protein